MSATSHLLVVDDEPKLCKTLAMIVHGAGYQAAAVGDASTALQVLNEADFDLVVMDWQLPDMEGSALLKEIRRLYPKLPVIVITGNGSKEIADVVIQNGARYFLLKPFEPKFFLSLVSDILRKDRILRPGNEFYKDIQAHYTHV
jgi:DNA-binding NtrC family response regulator